MSSIETTASSPFAARRVAAAPRTESRRFYVNMAYACALVAIAGFIPTFWAPVASGSFQGPSRLYLHGLLFTAWPLLFIVQSTLAATGRYERHRMLGLLGISLATAMFFAGVSVAIGSMENRIANGFAQPGRAFAIVPLSTVAFFAATVAAAIAFVRRSDVHLRLMLVASIVILPPAIARIVLLLRTGVARPSLSGPLSVEFALISAMIANVLLLVAIVRDWRVNGRPHRAYLIAGACLVGMQLLRIPISRTPAWHGFMDWLIAF